jgi:glycerol-3-phosphate O-acyltransferase
MLILKLLKHFKKMIIEINPNKKLKDINSAFTKVYPFLKLEFFSKSHKWHESSATKDLLQQDQTVSEVTHSSNNSGFIEIHYWQKTGVLEMMFLQQFNLSVQVYRKNGDHWIQTSGTDQLTLEEQNEAGLKDAQIHRGFARTADMEKNI